MLRLNNKIKATENKIIVRVLKDEDSDVCLFYCYSAGSRVSIFLDTCTQKVEVSFRYCMYTTGATFLLARSFLL